jgi:Signal peptidase, peptidase S26
VTGEQETVLDSKQTDVKTAGSYRLRFGNVDERLLVWVNASLPFGEGVPYPALSRPGPTAENDLRWPASIGAREADVEVARLWLWQDTYYGANASSPDAGVEVDFGDPTEWEPLRDLPIRTYYVQPGHYFVLGDNSPESSDSRSWGLVPERLLLGRTFFLYYPFSRMGPVR